MVYCGLVWCIVCYGDVVCGRAVYYVVGRCTVCYGGELYVRVVYCVGRAM